MSMQLTRGAEGLDRRAFTVEEVERMLEAGILDWDDKFELIDGELVPMNAQNTPHSLIKSRIGRWFGRVLDDSFDVGVDVTIRVHEKALLEPDVVLMRRLDAKAKGFVNISAALLVIEVADTTLKRDMGVKARAYAKAGLAELWVVDLEARVTHVHRAPGGKGYGSITPVAFDAALTPLSFAAPGLRVVELET
jgi:Uma2 family endonuclease